MLREDIDRTLATCKNSGIKAFITCFRAPGVKATIALRFGQWLLKQNRFVRFFLSPIYYSYRYRVLTNWGIDIPKEATIGPGLYVAHFGGIIVSPYAVIGKNLDISQGVTIGISGEGEKRGVPTIGDNVYIGPGAKLFGKITIGNNVKIGANAVIHRDIPDNAIVVLKPGFEIISFDSKRAEEIESRRNKA